MSFVNGIVYLDQADDFNNYLTISLHSASIKYGMKVTYDIWSLVSLEKRYPLTYLPTLHANSCFFDIFCCLENNSRIRTHQGLKEADNSDLQQSLPWETELQTLSVCVTKLWATRKKGAKRTCSSDSLKMLFMAILRCHNAGNSSLWYRKHFFILMLSDFSL